MIRISAQFLDRKARPAKLMSCVSLCILFLAGGYSQRLEARTGRSNLLYIINNNPAVGQNAVLGYSRNPDGSLIDLPGSPFFTGGTGYRNINERIGPDDTDGELIISPDHRFLFATNTGSDNISVFRVRLDGSLALVPGSPFPSGGKQPISLALSNGFLYVANRGDGILPTQVVPTYTAGTPGATNYSVLSVGGDGSLTLLPNLKYNAPDGSSPSQVVASPDGQFVFADTFLSPSSDPPFAGIFPNPGARSLLVSFATDEDDGSLESQPAVGLPRQAPFIINNVFRPFLLGMRPHPTQNILFVDAVAAGALAVYSWDSGGALTYVTAVGANGAGVQCWTAIDPAAKFLYASAIGPDVVSVFNIQNPMAPTFVQNFNLGGPRANLPAGTPEPVAFTTAPFNLSFSPDGKYLYVVNHETCVSQTIDPACASGNAIHIMTQNSDGTLNELPFSPLIFPPTVVPNETHPKGIVVL